MLSLPREVGADKDGEMITAQNGRYGPYLKKGSDSRSLSSEEQIFEITLEEAQRIYALPKQRGRGAAKPPLKDLGTDPITDKPMIIKDGRFGEYITDGETNVTIPRSESVEQMTAERASQLLSEKRAKGPAAKKTTRSSSGSRAKKPSGASTTKRAGTRKKTSASS